MIFSADKRSQYFLKELSLWSEGGERGGIHLMNAILFKIVYYVEESCGQKIVRVEIEWKTGNNRKSDSCRYWRRYRHVIKCNASNKIECAGTHLKSSKNFRAYFSRRYREKIIRFAESYNSRSNFRNYLQVIFVRITGIHIRVSFGKQI